MCVIFVPAIEQPFSFTDPNHQCRAFYLRFSSRTTSVVLFVHISSYEQPINCMRLTFVSVTEQLSSIRLIFVSETDQPVT
jgi:hypothetical protein